MTPQPADGTSPAFQDLEFKIALLLRRGVILAGLLMLVGWIGDWNNSAEAIQQLNVYQKQDLWVTLRADIGWARATEYLGLFLLLLLPSARVLFSSILLWRQKDRALAIVAGVVFVLIAISFSLGFEL